MFSLDFWTLGHRQVLTWFDCQLLKRLPMGYEDLNGLFGWRGEGGGVEGSRVVLAKNKLILC